MASSVPPMCDHVRLRVGRAMLYVPCECTSPWVEWQLHPLVTVERIHAWRDDAGGVDFAYVEVPPLRWQMALFALHDSLEWLDMEDLSALLSEAPMLCYSC